MKTRALQPKENDLNSDKETFERIKKPKRIIIEEEDDDDEDDSDSSDEDDVPLFRRKAVQNLNVKNGAPTKKVKLSNAIEGLAVSSKNASNPRKTIKSPKSSNPIKAPTGPKTIGFKATLMTRSNDGFGAPMAPASNKFKTPAPINSNEGFKAPLIPLKPASNGEFKAPMAPRTNEFKAPLPPSSTNTFKAPTLPSSNGFKAPVSISSDQAQENPTSFIVEEQQQDLTSSRLAHYMTSICEDLDKYNADKIKCVDSLLTFRDDDDLPMLDISVMRKFTLLISTINRQFRSLDSVDMVQFGKVIKLMENTIIVSADMDVIDYYVKNTSDRKEATLKMVDQINEALETCGMIFEILTTCKLDKKFLSRNLITNCLHFIKNQLDYTIYPLIDLNGFEDDANSLSSDAKTFLSLILSSPKERKLISTFIPQIVRFFKRAFTLILSEDLDDDVLVIIAYISMAPFFHEYTEAHKSILLSTQDNEFNPYEHLKFCALDILKHIFSRYPKHRRWIFEEILTSLSTLTTMEGKRSYRLSDNQSIHVISALFMQLVQCTSSLSDIATHKNWFKKWNIKYQKISKSKDEDQMKLLDDKLINRATTAWRMSAESAANSASFFLEFLMAKCKSRKIDSYSLAEYRQILFQTLQDVMVVFNDPEWPVAELIMKVFSRILISLLEENRSDQFLKTLAIEWLGIIACKIKTGYNRLAGGYKTFTPEWTCELNETLPIKVDMETPITSIALLDQCRKKLLDYVVEERVSSSVTSFYLCNWGFVESVLWTKANKGWEVKERRSRLKPTITAAVNKDSEQQNQVKDVEEKEDSEEKQLDGEEIDEDTIIPDASTDGIDLMEQDEIKWPKETALLLGETCKYYWLTCLNIDHDYPVYDTKFTFPEMARKDYGLLTELLASRQTLYTSFNFILSEILTCMEKDAVLYRTKALRAIGKIANEVPEILEEKRIYNSVVQKIHDGSPSVRDAAVEVVAKYLGRLDTVPTKLYQVISGRILDTAVNVRKRLVKLLRELYFRFSDPEIKIDMASKLILRIGDNEITISQLALKVTQEILFQPFKEIEKEGNDYFGYSYANSPKERKRKITDLTKVITGAVSKLDSSIAAQNAALSQIIQKTIEGADEKTKPWYDKVFQWIVDSLFDQMIALDEEGRQKEFIHCLATVYSFSKSCPYLLRETQISMLQPYLCISTEDDWTKARYVLTIYRDVLPLVKYHDPDFIQSVERILLQLTSKCPKDIVSYGVSCLCVIVDRISSRYNILIKMLGSCVSKLRQVRQLIEHGGDLPGGSFAGVLKMLMICGLLCQNFEFDKKREKEPDAMTALNLVYRGEINTLVFDLLQFFTGDIMDDLNEEGITMRMTALQGLGYFFSSYPIFMIAETSTALMDKIFEQGTKELKTQLMHVFQEFLAAEEKRIGKKEEEAGTSLYYKEVDVDTLLGNTSEYAELGVNGSLMQRYLKKILKCALSDSDELRYSAFEVVTSIINQGLAHPVLCMPAIVAAETSPDVILRTKAYYLHRYAHDKYGSILYSRLGEYLSTSYDYQKLVLNGGHVQGYGKRGGDSKVDPVLGLTYSVLKEKKKPRFDFFSALVNPYKFDLKSTSPEDVDVYYLKYLAENTITLDFCSTDEVLHVVYHMDRILMTLGADLLSYVHFLKKQNAIDILTSDEDDFDESSVEDELDRDLLVASKLSLAMCILLYVKNLLVELYDIPDDEIREYNPNIKKKARDVSKDVDVNAFIDWDQLVYFKSGGTLNKKSASNACLKFEYLIMSDTTAVIVGEDYDEN